MTFFAPSTASSKRGDAVTTISSGRSQVFFGPFSTLKWFCYTYWKLEALSFNVGGFFPQLLSQKMSQVTSPPKCGHPPLCGWSMKDPQQHQGI